MDGHSPARLRQAHGNVAALAVFIAVMSLVPGVALADPTIKIIGVPQYGGTGLLQGVVAHVPFDQYRVAPYIQIEGLGWWTKPTVATPTVPINGDGTFAANVFTGGLDNRATIFCVALLPAGVTPPLATGSHRVPASLNAIAFDCAQRFGRTISFAGRTWAVKEAPLPVGPGDNRFSDGPEDVWVDSEGLHLTIRQRNGQWWSTEVILLDRLGYGSYVFKTRSRTDILDANATLGLFTWDPFGDSDTPGSPHREIDIEDSRWAVAGDPNTQAVVQPWDVPGNRHRFHLPDLSADARLTRVFTWEPTTIHALTLAGHQSPKDYPTASVIDDWTYQHESSAQHYVPTPGRESVRLNLWLNQPAPANGQAIEVVITDFSFVDSPADVAANFGPPYGTWVLGGATWMPVHGFSPVAMVTGDLDGNGLDDLVADFGPGFGVWAWMNHSAWVLIHAMSPSRMVTGDLDHNGHDDIVLVFAGFGVWRWSDGHWFNVHGLDATQLAIGEIDGVIGSDLLIDLPGYGLYVFANNTTWSVLHTLHANALLTADLDGNGRDDIVIDFGPPNGLWVYRNNDTWMRLHPLSPMHLAAGSIDDSAGADLVVDFGAPYGLWTLRNNATWIPLHGFTAEGIVLGDRDGSGRDDVIIDFGPGKGLWEYRNDSAWYQLHGLNAQTAITGRFH
jgi:hypothetical protein